MFVPVSVGDICCYRFHDCDNRSISIVRVLKIIDESRGVARVKFLASVDDFTGNGYFRFLAKNGYSMNVSIKYLVPLRLELNEVC